jgi:uncharacterized membrane protein YagU involved in acid resistance
MDISLSFVIFLLAISLILCIVFATLYALSDQKYKSSMLALTCIFGIIFIIFAGMIVFPYSLFSESRYEVAK